MGRCPVKACMRAFWPLPATPATPTISLALTCKLKPSTALSPRSPTTTKSSILSCTGSSLEDSLGGKSNTTRDSPTMREANWADEVMRTGILSTSRPWRKTLTSSA